MNEIDRIMLERGLSRKAAAQYVRRQRAKNAPPSDEQELERQREAGLKDEPPSAPVIVLDEAQHLTPAQQQVAAEPTAEVRKQPTPDEIYNAFAGQVEQRWNNVANSIRSKTAFKRGLIKGDGTPTEAGMAKLKDVLFNDKPVDATKPLPLPLLRVLAPLEGDTIRYAKYPKGHKRAGEARMAVDKYGFPSAPKVGRLRKHPHASSADLSVKSLAKSIFRTLFEAKAETLKAEAKGQEVEYQGVPEDQIPVIGAQAMKRAALIVAQRARVRRKAARRNQKFSRRVNAGLMPGNTNRRKFAHKGAY